MIKKLTALILAFYCLQSYSQTNTPKEVFIFCYFKGNGVDGLHLAYSNNGLQWLALKKDSSFLKPNVAKDKLMRDPCIIRGADNQFHMVWTVSWNEKGIGYASSPDLVHWSAQQFIPVMTAEAGALNCWAPEITYDGPSKTYIIYWATTITGRFPLVDTLSEKKYNHRIYYVTTKDFKTISDTKLLFDPGYNVIDATIIPLKKGYVMFFKDETRNPVQKNIKVAFADELTGPYRAQSKPITGNYWAEGPTTLRTDGRWTIYFDRYTEHRYGAVSSTDLKTWTDISDQVLLPPGIRHGTIFKITDEEFRNLRRLAGN